MSDDVIVIAINNSASHSHAKHRTIHVNRETLGQVKKKRLRHWVFLETLLGFYTVIHICYGLMFRLRIKKADPFLAFIEK